MACCGGMRQRFRENTAPNTPARRPERAAPTPPPVPSGASATFEYVGRTALVVDGPYTKRRYRFDRPGARMDVDARDAAACASVPVLRRV
jgi:hypothetical protein